MKKLLTILLLTFSLFTPAIAVSGNAAAVNIFSKSCQGQPNSSVCQEVNQQSTKNNPIINIIRVAIEVISIMVGAAAIIGIIVSGLRMILANGDSNAVASARTGLIYSLVGIGVVVLAQTIVIFVIDNL